MLLDCHERLLNLKEKIKQEKLILEDEIHYLIINKEKSKVAWYKIPGMLLYFTILPIWDPVHYKLIMKTLVRITTTNPEIQKDDPRQN